MGRRAVILGTLTGPGTGQVLAPLSVCLSSWCPGLLQCLQDWGGGGERGPWGGREQGPGSSPSPGSCLLRR